jgi:hypothetical protein
MFAQAMIEKGSLDGMSTGMSSFRYSFDQFIQDERALWLLGVAVVLLFVWRIRKT